MNDKNEILGSIYLISAAVIWGLMYVVSKYALGFFDPILLVFLRFVISSLIFAILIFIKKERLLSRGDLPLLILTGITGYTISIPFQFSGTKLTSAHLGSIITSLSPIFIALFSSLILKEKIKTKSIISLVIATSGVLIIANVFDKKILNLTAFNQDFIKGVFYLFLAAVSWGLYSVFLKILTLDYSPLLITGMANISGTIFLIPLVPFKTFNLTVFRSPLLIFAVLYLGIISTFVAFFLWTYGIKKVRSLMKPSLFFFFQPLTGTVLGFLLLKEHIEVSTIIGGALILFGIVIQEFKRG